MLPFLVSGDGWVDVTINSCDLYWRQRRSLLCYGPGDSSPLRLFLAQQAGRCLESLAMTQISCSEDRYIIRDTTRARVLSLPISIRTGTYRSLPMALGHQIGIFFFEI